MIENLTEEPANIFYDTSMSERTNESSTGKVKHARKAKRVTMQTHRTLFTVWPFFLYGNWICVNRSIACFILQRLEPFQAYFRHNGFRHTLKKQLFVAEFSCLSRALMRISCHVCSNTLVKRTNFVYKWLRPAAYWIKISSSIVVCSNNDDGELYCELFDNSVGNEFIDFWWSTCG